MIKRKLLFTFVFVMFAAVSGFSQSVSIGFIGSYNQFEPSFWSIGYMVEASSRNSDENAFVFRIGMTFGKITLNYEKENIFTSTREKEQYWQKSNYMDLVFIGIAYQILPISKLAIRFGADFLFSHAYAYMHNDFNKDIPYNVSLTGLAGLKFFAIGRILYLNMDVCPGFTLHPFRDVNNGFAFILPVRLSVGVNLDVGR